MINVAIKPSMITLMYRTFLKISLIFYNNKSKRKFLKWPEVGGAVYTVGDVMDHLTSHERAQNSPPSEMTEEN